VVGENKLLLQKQKLLVFNLNAKEDVGGDQTVIQRRRN
jgi:hypothetical protein